VSGALKCPIIAATFHCGITSLIGCLKNTHPLGRVSLASEDGRAPKNKMPPMGISASTRRRPWRGLQQSTLTWWRRQRPWRQSEQDGDVPGRKSNAGGREWHQSQTINGSPRRSVSAGGGHGPILLGKSEAGGGVNCVYPETYYFLRKSTGRFFTFCRDFLHRTCKKSQDSVKRCNWIIEIFCSSQSVSMVLYLHSRGILFFYTHIIIITPYWVTAIIGIKFILAIYAGINRE
jgi:hypothetical protein